MILARLIVIVGLLAARHGHHDADRLRAVAEGIWHAAEATPAYCSAPDSDAAQYATALSLVGIALHESGLHPKVQTCQYRPSDPAVSLFALQGPVARGGYTRAEVCSDNALAAVLAADVLARYRTAGSVLVQARGYASGDPRVRSRAATEIEAIIARLHWGERIVVGYRFGCLTAAYRED